MGFNNGRTSERVYNDIVKRQYYRVDQACEFINKELGLSAKDSIFPHIIMYWKKKKYITYNSRQGSRARVTADQYEVIKAFTFFHVTLGISYKKLMTAINYLHGVVVQRTEETSQLNNYIQIYVNKTRSKQY